jgi:hypothetical protein
VSSEVETPDADAWCLDFARHERGVDGEPEFKRSLKVSFHRLRSLPVSLAESDACLIVLGEFPTTAAAVTPRWIEAQLARAGLLGDARITGLAWQAIGTGQVGDTARFTLTYDRPRLRPPRWRASSRPPIRPAGRRRRR